MRFVRILAALAALPLAALPVHATTFTDGEFVTWSQGGWGGDPAPGTISFLLETNFNSIFAPSGLLELGIPGSAGFSMIFDSADAVIAYLPNGDPPGVLIADLLDPVSSAGGVFGGEVVTAALNIAFSDAGLLEHAPGVPFGDLVLQNLDSLTGVGPEVADLDGMSVREVLSAAELLLGGAASPLSPEDMFILLTQVNMSFNGGNPASDFATEFLALPGSPTVPEPSTWAMLLIGFAGLGFAGWRKSRRGEIITR